MIQRSTYGSLRSSQRHAFGLSLPYGLSKEQSWTTPPCPCLNGQSSPVFEIIKSYVGTRPGGCWDKCLTTGLAGSQLGQALHYIDTLSIPVKLAGGA